MTTLDEELQAITALLDALETCHICKGTLSLDDTEATHCENCSWDCDEHDEPECVPLYVLHQNARQAVAALTAELSAAREDAARLAAEADKDFDAQWAAIRGRPR